MHARSAPRTSPQAITHGWHRTTSEGTRLQNGGRRRQGPELCPLRRPERERLDEMLLPIGDYTKDDIRANLREEIGIAVSSTSPTPRRSASSRTTIMQDSWSEQAPDAMQRGCPSRMLMEINDRYARWTPALHDRTATRHRRLDRSSALRCRQGCREEHDYSRATRMHLAAGRMHRRRSSNWHVDSWDDIPSPARQRSVTTPKLQSPPPFGPALTN